MKSIDYCSNSSTIIIIPARLSASRLPDKPLKIIGDKPMIIHCLDRAREANIAEVLVAAGDQEIFDCVKDYGGNAILTDPILPSGSDRVAIAIEQWDSVGKYNYIINLQGDMPLVSREILHLMIKNRKKESQSVRTLATIVDDVSNISKNTIVKVRAKFNFYQSGESTRALTFSRQLMSYNNEPLLHHIGIYGFPRQILRNFCRLMPSISERREQLEQMRLLENGYIIEVILTENAPLSVDIPEDLNLARQKWHTHH